MASELTATEQVAMLRQDLQAVLWQGERQRRELRDEVLRLAWEVGVARDDAAVLEAAANLPVVDLVRTVRQRVLAMRVGGGQPVRMVGHVPVPGAPGMVQRIEFTAESLAGGDKSGGAA